MSSQHLVLGLPRVLPSLPPSLAPPCGPCIEGRLRATPHSSSLRPATEPFETLYLDSDVTSTLIRWLLTTPDTRGRRVTYLHSNHGGLVMEIAGTSMIHARAPHFLWPYAVRYAAHRLNLWPLVSRPEVSPTSLWTGSPGVASRFRVWGFLVLVCDTSVDKISPRAIPCVFLGFSEDSSDYTFYHPPLHRFFDSREVRFDESVPYYVRYPCRGLPVPPPPLFMTSAPPPAPSVQPPPLVPPRQPTADPAGAGFRGEDPGGASSRGARVGAESVPVRGPGSGGAGVGAEHVTVGDSSLRGAGVSGAIPGGAMTGGAPSAGPREPGTDPVTSGGAASGGGATGSLESGPGATTARDTTPPPHPYPTRHQARVRRAREEQLELEREERELGRQQQQQQPEQEQPQQQQEQQQPPQLEEQQSQPQQEQQQQPPPPPVSSPLLPAPNPSPALFPPPLPSLSPPLSHACPLRRSPRARPLSPVPFTDLRTALFRSSPPRSSPSVLPSPPESALTASLTTPVTEYYALTEFASTRCLDYATSLVAAPPTSPLAVGGESALGCDALEDTQFELEFLAATSPHLCAMLLAREGDPDALDIPTPRTYVEAVSWPWASQWRAAMDSEMASYKSTGTYVDEVPPLGANVVDGMWILRMKRPPESPPVFKARYVATGFSQREGVDFFQTFAPTPKMTTLWVLLHVAAQRDYELHSLDFSTAFLQGSLHEEAPREWHDTLRSTLSNLGFQPSSADPSMFVRRGSTPFFVLVYIDDLVFATADKVALADVKRKLQKRHTCTDLGELRHYLGLQITRDRAACTITLSQSHMPSGPYAELVGCLMYLMTCTRPDLAFPLSILAHFVAPGRHHPVHWTAPVRVAKYLATTSGMGLVLGERHDIVLTSHCDSSYADDAKMHRSTQRYYFSLGSGAASWRSTRSSLVSTSTAEAEIYAGAMAAQ
ncbi:unnamed protein product [Closterium sp. NIES-53]